MADVTYENALKAMRLAYEKGDTAAAKRMAQLAKSLQGKNGKADAAQADSARQSPSQFEPFQQGSPNRAIQLEPFQQGAANRAGQFEPFQQGAPNRAIQLEPALQGGRAPAAIVPPMAMPRNPELVTQGPGPTGAGLRELYDAGILPRRYQEGPAVAAQPTDGEIAAAVERERLAQAERVRLAQIAAQPRLPPEAVRQEPIAPNSFVTTAGDVVDATIAGLGRGSAMLADLPGAVRNLGIAGAEMVVGRPMTPAERQIITGLTVPQAGQGDMRGKLEAATGGASEFKGNTIPGQFAGTIAEFAPSAAMFGGGSAANLARNAVLPGIGSEVAGQLTKDTPFEDVARVAGAILGGVSPDIVKFGTKSFQKAFAMSAEKPTVESLRTVKNIAYKAVDEAGEKFQPTELQGMLANVRNNLDDVNYLPEADTTTAAILKKLDDLSAREITLGQLDKMRQTVWARYNSTKEPGLLEVIDGIDELVMSRANTSELLNAARLANSRYKKAELLDLAFQKAADQTAATGSGGNILNKYRQAVTSIINDPKQAKWFSAEEIEVMRQFVRGTPSQNALRLVGKLSPSGNGLMTALNLGAAGAWGAPAVIAAGVASGAKAIADGSQGRAAEGLIDMVATGRVPQRAAPGVSNLSIPVAGVGVVSDARR